VIEALGYPFVQRALVAGLLVGLVTSVLGVLVVLRRSAFFGDAVAHASLAGVAAGVVTGTSPLALAAVVAVSIGLSLHRLERSARLSLDTILGFVLPFFMAIGVLLLSLSPARARHGVRGLRSRRRPRRRPQRRAAPDHVPRPARAGRHREHQRGRDRPGERAAGDSGRDRQAAGALPPADVRAGPSDRPLERARRARRLYRLDLPSGPAIVVVAGLALLAAWASAAARRAGARSAR
jgi:hypothetical protein